MPEEGIQLIRHRDILSYDEIRDAVQYAVAQGINKVRITGGEPLVRKGIVNLVSMLAEIKGIEDLAMTTNGILLDKYAHDLVKAGLHRVNVSLDTLDDHLYNEITRVGNLQDVLKGIEAAKDAGLNPIKLNCVRLKQHSGQQEKELREFAQRNEYQVRFIRQMDLSCGEFSVVEGGDGGNCIRCNRLRLTADGNVKPCLFSDIAYNIRDLGVQHAFSLALANKPESGSKNQKDRFYNIGG